MLLPSYFLWKQARRKKLSTGPPRKSLATAMKTLASASCALAEGNSREASHVGIRHGRIVQLAKCRDKQLAWKTNTPQAGGQRLAGSCKLTLRQSFGGEHDHGAPPEVSGCSRTPSSRGSCARVKDQIERTVSQLSFTKRASVTRPADQHGYDQECSEMTRSESLAGLRCICIKLLGTWSMCCETGRSLVLIQNAWQTGQAALFHVSTTCTVQIGASMANLWKSRSNT